MRVAHPTEQEMYQYKELVRGEVKNKNSAHPLNNKKEMSLMENRQVINLRDECEDSANCAKLIDGRVTPSCETCKSRVKKGPKVSSFCFDRDRMITGYSDGLICIWNNDGELVQNKKEEIIPEFVPCMGHTNRINHLMVVPETFTLFSCSNDCTIRQWAMHTALCERMYKFSDPMYYIAYYQPKNLLFTSSWDKKIRALNFDTGVVESSFVGAREPVLVMTINENKLYLAG